METVKEAYTSKELAELLGVSQQAIDKRARREGWHSRLRQGRGGGHEWFLQSMPQATRQAIAAAIATRIASAQEAAALMPGAASGLNNGSGPLPALIAANRLAAVNTLADVPERKRERAGARALIVSMAREFGAAAGVARTMAYETFAHEYNRGAVAVPEWVRAKLPRVCRASIMNWEAAIMRKGMAALAGRHGHRKGSGLIDSTPGMAEVVIAHIIDIRHCTAEDVEDALQVKFPDAKLPSKRNIQRWMKNYRDENEAVILKIQNPDGYRSKYQSASGSRSEDIFSLNQLWEMDSSPADILLADGKRYTLIGAIDVGTRRARLHLAKTSSAQGVCSVLRRAITDFGVPQSVKIDNGKDYTSFQVSTVLHDLRIVTEFCTPFSPEQKPHIERFFGTFQRALKRLPGFIGHSVSDRKAIESRKSFAERLSKKAGEKPALELNYTFEEFQRYCDIFCDEIYGEKVHSALKTSPNEAAARLMASGDAPRMADERALDLLLMPLARNGGRCTVGKKGLRVNNGAYDAPELGGLDGQEVIVRLDERDAGYVYVFNLDGIFICKAEDPDLTGASLQALALARRAFQNAHISAETKKARKAVANVKPKELVPLIVEAKQIQAAKNRAEREARFGAAATEGYSTPALKEAARAAAEAARPADHAPAPITDAEREAMARAEAAIAACAAKPKPTEETPEARYARARDLESALALNAAVAPQDADWLRRYQSTPEYDAQRLLYEFYGDQQVAVAG